MLWYMITLYIVLQFTMDCGVRECAGGIEISLKFLNLAESKTQSLVLKLCMLIPPSLHSKPDY